MRILLIEDDALLADGLARALRHSGYVVDIADNGQLADKLLADSAYELAILDLGLPGLDGGEVLRRLRSRQQKTPVLVLSARLAVEERVRVLDLGADDYVVKPVRLDELEARVRALIRRGQGAAVPDLMLGRLRLDTVGKRAWLDDKALDLNAREWAALAFLTSHELVGAHHSEAGHPRLCAFAPLVGRHVVGCCDRQRVTRGLESRTLDGSGAAHF